MANILYFGDSSSGATSAHRANALKRVGHNVMVSDPYKVVETNLGSRIFGPIHFRTGYKLLQSKIAKWIRGVLEGVATKPDLIWVDLGELMGPNCLKEMQKVGCPIVLYNIDDPTGKRDGRRFDSLIDAISYYDLVAVVRTETALECEQLGARHVIRVYRSYDEIAHQPFSSLAEIPDKFKSDVAFIGTWMRYEKRDEFLLELISRGVPVSIWGDRWQKSPNFSQLQSHWRGGALSGRDYVAAVQGAKICLGLLSKGNRDLHTTRSLEVPFSGGLLCAERTSEHTEMYKEGVEAVFWSDASECAQVCKKLLNDEVRREEIRVAGMKKVRSLKVGNEDICDKILKIALSPASKN
jgi:spore maturation protein CgeB